MRMYRLTKKLPEHIEHKIISITDGYYMKNSSHITHIKWGVVQMFNLFGFVSLNKIDDIEIKRSEKK